MEETEILASSTSTTMSTNDNTTEFELPLVMRFNKGHVVSIVTYSILIVFSAIGNLTVLFLIRQRRGNPRSRINTMLMHLAIADLLVRQVSQSSVHLILILIRHRFVYYYDETRTKNVDYMNDIETSFSTQRTTVDWDPSASTNSIISNRIVSVLE